MLKLKLTAQCCNSHTIRTTNKSEIKKITSVKIFSCVPCHKTKLIYEAIFLNRKYAGMRPKVPNKENHIFVLDENCSLERGNFFSACTRNEMRKQTARTEIDAKEVRAKLAIEFYLASYGR